MKLKRIGITVLGIVMIFLLLVIGVTPIAASGNGGAGGGAGGWPQGGQFLVVLCGQWQQYPWVEPWQNGRTLADPVNQVGRCCCFSLPTQYKLIIPAGTEITGYYSWGGIPLKAHFIEFTVIEGQLHFSPNLKLSQPAILYKLVDGEWVEVLSFTQVLNGKAS